MDSEKSIIEDNKEEDTKALIKEILATEKKKCKYIKFIALCVGILTIIISVLILLVWIGVIY